LTDLFFVLFLEQPQLPKRRLGTATQSFGHPELSLFSPVLIVEEFFFLLSFFLGMFFFLSCFLGFLNPRKQESEKNIPRKKERKKERKKISSTI